MAKVGTVIELIAVNFRTGEVNELSGLVKKFDAEGSSSTVPREPLRSTARPSPLEGAAKPCRMA